ncbi:MAG: hypothetical protein LW630_07720 [Saprospiraceae bacterium]|nr:hypothetical protein [Saprospiraceae bacterium]
MQESFHFGLEGNQYSLGHIIYSEEVYNPKGCRNSNNGKAKYHYSHRGVLHGDTILRALYLFSVFFVRQLLFPCIIHPMENQQCHIFLMRRHVDGGNTKPGLKSRSRIASFALPSNIAELWLKKALRHSFGVMALNKGNERMFFT